MSGKKRTFIYDIKTRNLSFLQVAVDLKRLGIKNNMFFLRLYDETLQGVDPFSPYLTEDQMVRIINECMVNPWYFLRECVRIPDQGGNGIPYQLHRANLAQTFCFLLGIDHYVVIPRQKGKTQSAIAIIDWAFLFGTTNSEIAFINKRSEDAINNLARLKAQRDLLPSYMQMKIAYDEDGDEVKERNNVKSLMNPTNKNRIVTKPSATSIQAADGIGRGNTQPIQYYDEVEFTPFIKTIIEAAGPAFVTAARNAKRNNSAYCRIFTSTPGDLDTQPGQDAMEIISKTCKWTEKFYDWSLDDINEYIEKCSENKIVYIEYSYIQLGEGEEWFNEQCRILNNNPQKIKREILLKRMRGSQDSPFDPEDLDALPDMKGIIKDEIFINKLFPLYIYEELDKERIYMVGVDVASGYGDRRDNSALTIVDPYTLKVVAEFKSPYISEAEFTKFIYTLVRRYIPRAIVIIERNKGSAIIEFLRQTEIARNIYFENVKDPMEESVVDRLDNKGFLKKEANKRRMFGVWTGPKSRERMFELLYVHVKEKKDKLIGQFLIDDILSLVVTKGGKIVAGQGFHDDNVMSYLMVLYVYYHGNNLSRFGFTKGSLPDENERNKGLDYEDIYEELPEDLKEAFKNVGSKTLADYQNDMAMEIMRARRESNMIDAMLRPKNYVEDQDAYDEDMIDMDLFDELNN
jgi:hypothetical protein